MAVFKVLCSLLGLLTVVDALAQVQLGKATLVGRDVSDTVQFFGAIPFADPPLGQLRLKPPVLKTRLPPAVFNATAYGNACIQPPDEEGVSPPQSEDCLFINVYRPSSVPLTRKLPILFWTYGGSFARGSSTDFDGKDLVARSIKRGTPMIYVNFNYRLGPLGFPQGQEADDKRALNLGILDQIAALEWVQANIHAFGGDKDKVTISGESAGAIMTGVLFLNPHLGRLARAGILESGSPNGIAANPASRNEAAWKSFVEKVPSCASVAGTVDTFSCLKNATTDDIAAAIHQSISQSLSPVWAPTLDPGRGGLIPDYPSRLYEKGYFARLPFIAGTNTDEGTLFSIQQPLTDELLKAILISEYSPAATSIAELTSVADTLLKLYPADPTVGSPYGTGDELFGLPASYKRVASVVGDVNFDAPRRQWARAAAKAGVKSYGYHFTQPQPVPALGVYHSAEIVYVYAQPPPTDSTGQTISSIIADYWISFTVSLNPNDGKGVKRPNWPQYTTTNQVLLQLEAGNTTTVKDDFRKDQIDFLIKNSLVLRR
ncbi:triacylglycerol lipase 3 [Ephemerocybe angulata]|uniref:Carboxylic ester hydrolase n=1 Tax=Ephemerocybe angulata TaxID=980116 RepID=A0A8H6HFT0_9AGAR|nr:triacylglycerol lipase 3 [Tulosesus angulatus]